MRFHKSIASVLFISAICGSAAGDTIDSFILKRVAAIDFASTNAFAIGDGVEINDLTAPRGNCIDLANSPLKQDIPGGTIEILADVSVSSTIEELERKTNRSLAVEAGLKGDLIGVAKGSIDTKFTNSYEKFLNEQRSSLVVNVQIYADHGRDWLDYKIKDDVKGLLDDGDFDTFRATCGTHFIRAVRKEARLEYMLIVTGLSQLEKSLLKEMAEAKMEGSGSFAEILTVGAKGSLKSELEEFVKTSLEFGSVSSTSRLVGAPGIDAYAESLKVPEVKSENAVAGFFNGLSALAASFKGISGAPSQYILLQYPTLPADAEGYEDFFFKGELLRKLLIVDNALSANAALKEDLPKLWDEYFVEETENLTRLADVLVEQYRACDQNGECDKKLAEDPDPLTIEDVLFSGSIRAVCGNDFNAPGMTGIMSDAAIYWRGRMRFANYVSLSDTRPFYLNAALERMAISPFEYGYDFSIDPNFLASSGPNTDGSKRGGPARAIMQLVNESLASDDVLPSGVLNSEFLAEYRKNLADRVFGVTFRLSDGREITQLLGRADMRQCATIN